MSVAHQSTQPAESVTTTTSTLSETIDVTERRQSISAKASRILGVEPNKLCGLLRNVWSTSKGQEPLTDREMFAGISMIARYGLDPIAREVYVTRDGKGRLITMVGLDGWIKILDRTEHYDGFEVEVKTDEKGDVEWVETRIHSTRRSFPAVYRAYAREYAKMGGYVAGAIPTHMLRIFSFRHAARLFIPLGGNVVTEEEAAWLQRGADDGRFGSQDEPKTSKAQELADRMKSLQTPESEPEVDDLDQSQVEDADDVKATDSMAKAVAKMSPAEWKAALGDALSECKATEDVASLYNRWVAILPDHQDAIDEACTDRVSAIKGRS